MNCGFSMPSPLTGQKKIKAAFYSRKQKHSAFNILKSRRYPIPNSKFRKKNGLYRAPYDSAYPYVYDSALLTPSASNGKKKLFFLKSRYTETAFIEITALRTRQGCYYMSTRGTRGRCSAQSDPYVRLMAI